MVYTVNPPYNYKPTFVASSRLWLDANFLEGLSDTDPITTITDRSGQGNDATQATAAKKPTYETNEMKGRPVARYDGVDDYLAAAHDTSLDMGTSDFTVWMVLRFDGNPPSREDLLTQQTNDNNEGFTLYLSNAGRVRAIIGNGASNVGSANDGASIANNAPHIVIVTYDRDGNMARFVDGASYGADIDISSFSADDLNAIHDVVVGARGNTAGRFFEGDLPECGIHRHLFNAGERRRLEKYLGRKYGVALP